MRSTVFYPFVVLSWSVSLARPSCGVTYVPSVIFKTCPFTYWGGIHVAVSILLLYMWFSLSQFQPTFVSFVAIFLLSYVAVSRPCRLSEFDPNRVSLVAYQHIKKLYVVVNFLSQVIFYFCFVSTSLTYVTIPKNKRKTKIAWDKKLTTTYTKLILLLIIIDPCSLFSLL